MTAIATNAPRRAEFVERIKADWHRSRQWVLAMGCTLIEAKEALPYGEFTAMIESDLPFGPDAAQHFMRIAADPRLADPEISPALPTSVYALDELRKLNDGDLQEGVSAGDIHPRMTVAEAKALVGRPREPVHIPPRQPDDLKLPIIGPYDWTAAMKGYRMASGRSQLEIDERSGMQAGYTGKLELEIRRDFNESAWDRLNGLGLVMVLLPAVDVCDASKCALCGAKK